MTFSLFRKKIEPQPEAPGNESVTQMSPRVRAVVHSLQDRVAKVLNFVPQSPTVNGEVAVVPPIPEALKKLNGPKEIVKASTQPSEAQRGRYVGSTTATLRTKYSSLEQILSAETHQAMTQFGGKNSTGCAKGLTQFYLEYDFLPSPRQIVFVKDEHAQAYPQNQAASTSNLAA